MEDAPGREREPLWPALLLAAFTFVVVVAAGFAGSLRASHAITTFERYDVALPGATVIALNVLSPSPAGHAIRVVAALVLAGLAFLVGRRHPAVAGLAVLFLIGGALTALWFALDLPMRTLGPLAP